LSETRVANTCLVGSGPVRSGSVRVHLVEFGLYSAPRTPSYITGGKVMRLGKEEQAVVKKRRERGRENWSPSLPPPKNMNSVKAPGDDNHASLIWSGSQQKQRFLQRLNKLPFDYKHQFFSLASETQHSCGSRLASSVTVVQTQMKLPSKLQSNTGNKPTESTTSDFATLTLTLTATFIISPSFNSLSRLIFNKQQAGTTSNYDSNTPASLTKTRKPSPRKETARWRSCSFQFKVRWQHSLQ